MDERLIINKSKIYKDDLSKRYRFLIVGSVGQILGLAIGPLVLTLISDILVMNILVWSIFFLYAILKIFCCVQVIFLFKSMRFTIELDTIISVDHNRVYRGELFIGTRRGSRYAEKVVFENSGSVFVTADEINYPSIGERIYLVKIKVFNMDRVVSFYNERSYYYDGN